jgi:hypothetical protein
MLKKVLFFATLAFVAFSCNQAVENSEVANEDVLISQLISEPLEFEDKVVSIQGTITHFCRHSGDKMVVTQQDGENSYSIMVMLDEFQSQFCQDSEGMMIKVSGLLKTRSNCTDHVQAENHNCAEEKAAIKNEVLVYIDLTAFEMIASEESVSEVAEETEVAIAEENAEIAEVI